MKRLFVSTISQEDLRVIGQCFGEEFEIRQFTQGAAFLEALGQHQPDLAFVDVRLILDGSLSASQEQYRRVIKECWGASSNGPLIVLAPPELLREAVKAVRAGASNYLTSPINPAEVIYVTESLQEFELFKAELDYLRDHFWADDVLDFVRTESPVMRETLAKIRRVAVTPTTVLLTGETGTGKSTLARLIHRHSDRRDKQFISIHCGAIPDELIESELFGHERGAFTNAVRRKLGRFELADRGTIFLDEVGLLSPAAQVKLLSVIQERTFQRVGGEKDIHVDVRIIAATNVELEDLCHGGTFRRDLFFRLNVFPIRVPALRERIDDIPGMVRIFLGRLQQGQGKGIEGAEPRVLRAFERYPWPGNVRELENLVERAYILEEGPQLTAKSFPADLFASEELDAEPNPQGELSLSEFRSRGLAQLEREYLRSLLTGHQGRLREAAAIAGISLRQLHKLLTKYELRSELPGWPRRLRRELGVHSRRS